MSNTRDGQRTGVLIPRLPVDIVVECRVCRAKPGEECQEERQGAFSAEYVHYRRASDAETAGEKQASELRTLDSARAALRDEACRFAACCLLNATEQEGAGFDRATLATGRLEEAANAFVEARLAAVRVVEEGARL